MDITGSSLRAIVTKWLAPTACSPVALTRLRYANASSLRCVRAERIGSRHTVAIFFFQHGDGSWSVFPPAPPRPTMRAVAAADSGRVMDNRQ